MQHMQLECLLRLVQHSKSLLSAEALSTLTGTVLRSTSCRVSYTSQWSPVARWVQMPAVYKCSHHSQEWQCPCRSHAVAYLDLTGRTTVLSC
jgi:hypothetical protein